MSDTFLNDIIIQGITLKGKVFRPSDWSERLSGILSSFDQGNRRLSYHEHVRPLLINQIRCVVVDKNLEKINEGMFRFLMDFANDNHLRICDGSEVDSVRLDVQPAATAKAPTQERYRVDDIPPECTAIAFPAMQALRTHLTSVDDFVELVNHSLRLRGYRLIGVFEEGRKQALAVCGYRIKHNLAWGNYLGVDDLSTLPEHRQHGLGKRLLEHIIDIAQKEGGLPIHIDSAVGIERQNAHRLYFNAGFRISSYHFMRD